MRWKKLWCAVALAAIASVAFAQGDGSYPNRPIRFIVPYPPGGGTDFTAREIGNRVSETLGQTVVIDNRPGAGATLGHNLAAKAAPDGYTILLATTGGVVSGPALGVKIAYDPLKDFAHIGFEIKGELWALPNPERIFFRTDIDLETGVCEVNGAA